MDFKLFFSICFKCFHMASSDSKWVPKHPPDPKTSFGSPHAPYGHMKKIFTKSIFGLENAFFKLDALQGLKKCIFSRGFADLILLTTSFRD